MAALIPAPALCQGADEDLIIKLGAIIFPEFIKKNSNMKGLCLKIEGNYKDDSLLITAANQFQLLLGVLRAWNTMAGQRVDEIRPGIGLGSIQDEYGNQIIKPVSVISYNNFDSAVEEYAHQAKIATGHSLNLRNALWLNGRRDRNAADFYMVYEYAENDLGGSKAIIEALDVTDGDIARLKKSANNLAPTDGGRHAKGFGTAEWGLDDQMQFIARFLKEWIAYRGQKAA